MDVQTLFQMLFFHFFIPKNIQRDHTDDDRYCRAFYAKPFFQRSLFLIQGRLSNLGRYLDHKRTEMRRDFNLMKNNLWRVDFYSLGFCTFMIFVSYFQIVTIRSMFMEKVSFNIWARYTTSK